MSRFEDMQLFVRTVEAESFSAAARQLGMDKSAVSRRIAALEERLGNQLLTRTTRSLSLTSAGRTLYDKAIRLIADWEDAEAEARAEGQVLQGRIRIAAPLSFGVHHLGPQLLAFLKANSEVELDIDFADRKVDLIGEGFDLAIRIGKLSDSSLIAQKLASIPMIIAASPEYLAQYPAITHPDDLAAHLELRYSGRPDMHFDYVGPEGKDGRIALKPRMSASNGEFLRDAAIAGEGIVIEPSFIMCDAIRDGQLTQLLPDYALEDVGVYAVYPSARYLSRRVRTLIDYLKTAFQTAPSWDIE